MTGKSAGVWPDITTGYCRNFVHRIREECTVYREGVTTGGNDA